MITESTMIPGAYFIGYVIIISFPFIYYYMYAYFAYAFIATGSRQNEFTGFVHIFLKKWLL